MKSKLKNKNKQIGACQKQEMQGSKKCKGGQKVEISSYNIKKSCGCNVQHDD